MAELKCPKCGTTFKVDDTSYADILNQVRNHEFEAELEKRLEQSLRSEKQSHQAEIAELKAKFEQASTELKAKLAQNKTEFEAKLAQSKTEQELAVARATAPIERERDSLKNSLVAAQNEAKLNLETANSRAKLSEAALITKYESALKLKEEENERLKDRKNKLRNHNGKNHYPMNGKVFCKKCGNKLSGQVQYSKTNKNNEPVKQYKFSCKCPAVKTVNEKYLDDMGHL